MRDILVKYIKEHNYSLRELEKVMAEEDLFVSRRTIARYIDGSEITPRLLAKIDEFLEAYREAVMTLEDEVEEELENEKLLITQRVSDSNVVLRRELRTLKRGMSSFEELFIDMMDEISKTGYDLEVDRDILEPKTNSEMVVQLSDWHIGEMVRTDTSRFDYDTAINRIIEFGYKVKSEAERIGVSKINIVMTGDFINLDTHLDKLHSSEFNRGLSTVKCFQLLKAFINLFVTNFNVTLSGVVGNESRLTKDFPNTHILATNNLDYLLFQMLRAYYNQDQVEFLNDCDKIEDVIEVNGKRIYLTHGEKLAKGNLTKNVADVYGRFANARANIDYVMFGHIHQSYISELFGRSGSIVGGNGYSEIALNIPISKPSQNYYIIGNNIEGRMMAL